MRETWQFVSLSLFLCAPPAFVRVGHFNDICQKQGQWQIILKLSAINIWNMFCHITIRKVETDWFEHTVFARV
jgi:hypothetical protein